MKAYFLQHPRMFMSDKPHRYGSKLYFKLMWASRTTSMEVRTQLTSSSAAAVVRNLEAAFTPQSRHKWHAVVIDRYYTSILLPVELLRMKVYVVETIQTNRLRFNQRIKSERLRGRLVRQASLHDIVSLVGPQTGLLSLHRLCHDIERKDKRVGAIQVGRPQAVNDYQNWMRGFSGFLGPWVGERVPNTQRGGQDKKTIAMKRSEWFSVLQNQLLQLKAEVFAGVKATPHPSICKKQRRTPVRLAHALQQSEDWDTVSGDHKHRQRSRKVCALLKKKSYPTTYYYERCSIDNAKGWLCNKINRDYKGAAKTYFEIGHDDFGAGEDIPANLGIRVVLRL
ncbi:LOW QUALITY PROTEIN: hypothetical protein PHMEG_00033690 [Phytophthora megakarya]|uniref:PiggyBac transposable element-derived protein domain-containing protein n=1 Tax=Phytophthora megakarya TaxID=4795 RepID=A0A225UUA1_9STRA|nr:LOW QUALITY PROTEIN: hypothetical protein PHMEG_00033690 [Phytophthora megakarya]